MRKAATCLMVTSLIARRTYLWQMNPWIQQPCSCFPFFSPGTHVCRRHFEFNRICPLQMLDLFSRVTLYTVLNRAPRVFPAREARHTDISDSFFVWGHDHSSHVRGARFLIHVGDPHMSVSCHVMSCHVTSCPVLSCPVLSCHVMSCHVMSCHVMPLIATARQLITSPLSVEVRGPISRRGGCLATSAFLGRDGCQLL